MSYCVISAVTVSYFHYALTMANSVINNDDDCDVSLLLVDVSSSVLEDVRSRLPDRIIVTGIDEIRGGYFEHLKMYMSPFEICCAAKSIYSEYIISSGKYSKLIFFDADIYCVGDLSKIWNKLDVYSLIVTPHNVSPYPDDGSEPNKNTAIISGYINGGFFAVNIASKQACEAIHWLADTVRHNVFYMPEIGYYAEQTWISCLPWYFPEVTYVDRDVGLNVAYWNIYERYVSYRDSYFSNDSEVIFFHLSGYNYDRKSEFSQHNYREIDSDVRSVIEKMVAEYSVQVDHVYEQYLLNKISPNLPCMNHSLYRRLCNYRKIYGNWPALLNATGLQKLLCNVVIFYDLLQYIKKKIFG